MPKYEIFRSNCSLIPSAVSRAGLQAGADLGPGEAGARPQVALGDRAGGAAGGRPGPGPGRGRGQEGE